jgi:general secretion pathway protein F
LEGLRLTGGTIRNKVLSEANDEIVEAVRSGGSLSGAMRASGVFPPLLVYLTAILAILLPILQLQNLTGL